MYKPYLTGQLSCRAARHPSVGEGRVNGATSAHRFMSYHRPIDAHNEWPDRLDHGIALRFLKDVIA